MNYKFLIPLFLCASFVLSVQAKQVSESVAVSTADRMLAERARGSFIGGESTVTPIAKNNETVYYVVQYQTGGWALIAADDVVSPLLAYSETGVYPLDENEKPDAMKAWVDEYGDMIDLVRQSGITLRHHGWEPASLTRSAAAEDEYIEEMLPYTWNQPWPYNRSCPESPTATGSYLNGHYLVGCAAVACSQALSYIRYPSRPVGSHSYVTETQKIDLFIDYDKEAPYDWNLITDEKASNSEGFREVSRLLYHMGVALNMNYGDNASGAYTSALTAALTRNFGISEEACQLYYRANYRDDTWIRMMYENLRKGAVIVYNATNSAGTSGHSFNIDGYDGVSQFHVNWGWGGVGNGFFDLNHMVDQFQGIEFTSNHSAVLDILPSDMIYDIQLSSTSVSVGAPADTKVGDVIVESNVEGAEYEYTLQGPKNTQGGYARAGYKIVDNVLYTAEEVTTSARFKQVTITATNKESGRSLSKLFVIDTSGIEDNLASLFRIYPVPAEDLLTIDAPEAGTYTIYSVSGAEMLRGSVAGKTTVDISALPQGSYRLQFKGEKSNAVKAFIVK